MLTFCVIFIISFWNPHTVLEEAGGLRVPTQSMCVNLNLVLSVCRKKESLIWNYCRNYSVTLLIISLHSLLPAGRQVVSSCFHMHNPDGSSDDDAIHFFCFFFSMWGMKRREERRGEWDQYPPSAVKLYLYQHWHWEDKWPESTLRVPPLAGEEINK